LQYKDFPHLQGITGVRVIPKDPAHALKPKDRVQPYRRQIRWSDGEPHTLNALCFYLREHALHESLSYSVPPVYSFSVGESVTYPIRFDPAYWAQGVTPRFHLGFAPPGPLGDIP
jgi:hypothetical protein